MDLRIILGQNYRPKGESWPTLLVVVEASAGIAAAAAETIDSTVRSSADRNLRCSRSDR